MYLQDNGVPANEERGKKSISVNRNDEFFLKSILYTESSIHYDQGRWPRNHLGDTSFLMWIGMNYNEFLKLIYTLKITFRQKQIIY